MHVAAAILQVAHYRPEIHVAGGQGHVRALWRIYPLKLYVFPQRRFLNDIDGRATRFPLGVRVVIRQGILETDSDGPIRH